MPFGVEMLHLLGMEVMGDWWWGGLVGQLLVALFAPAAAVLIAAAAGLGGRRRAAWLAAIVYLSTPWIYRLAVIAYVEGPLCYLPRRAGLGGASRLERQDPGRRARGGRCSGLLAGGAMACKYPALISAVIPFGLLALADSWRSRSAAARRWPTSLGWSIVMVPWLVKNVIDHWQPGLSAGLFRLRRARTGTRRARRSGSTPTARRRPLSRRSGTRWSTWPADPTGNRRSTLAFAPLALLRPRLAAARAGPGRIRGLSVPDLVAPDPSTRPVLAAAPALPGDPGRARCRLVRGMALAILRGADPGARPCSATSSTAPRRWRA